jgi:hypothetical protein
MNQSINRRHVHVETIRPTKVLAYPLRFVPQPRPVVSTLCSAISNGRATSDATLILFVVVKFFFILFAVDSSELHD